MKAKELMTSKDKVTCLYNDMDLQECYKKLSESHFTMIPVLERESGRYLYSLSTLDILKSIMESNSLEKALKSPLTSIETERLIICAPIESEVADLVDLIANQNFVPIVNKKGEFEGIITRRKLIFHLKNIILKGRKK